ncbi:MAG: hypothetical protein J6U97_02670 [Bacteroidaceae bacterium]|nr:hypothetical protein [Bacteroidaceae bacterium]
MKIRNLFIAVMTLVLTVTGCSKVDTPAADNDLKFVFEMADKDGFGADTKAVKTGWADGDQVVILFKPEGQGQCLITQNPGSQMKYPKCVRGTFDGKDDEWNFALENFLLVGNLGAGGTYYAIHHRGDVNLEHRTEVEIGIDCFPLNYYEGGELLSYVGNYTVTGNVVNFGVIRMTLDPRLFQVSIPEILWQGGPFDPRFDLDKFVDGSGNDINDADIEDYMRTASVQLSVYNSFPSLNPVGYFALKSGMVSVDLTKPNIFVFNVNHSLPYTNASPVINLNDLKNREYSFCFAEPDLTSPKAVPGTYTFRVRRVDYDDSHKVPSSFEHQYYQVTTGENKKLEAGKAYMLYQDIWFNN